MWLVPALADVETSRLGIWQQQTRAEQVTRYTSPDRCSILLEIDHDQFLVVTLGDAKESTPIISKNLNPEWNVSFDLPVIGIQSLLLEAVCWDKDRMGKDYLGEFDVALEDIFDDGQVSQEVSMGVFLATPEIH